MSMKEAIDFIEEKRKQVGDRLEKSLNEGEISSVFYKELLELSEQLRQTLAVAFIEGRKLTEAGAIKDISDFFKLERKPVSRDQIFMKMKEEIEGRLGSKNICIQDKAGTIIEELNKRYNFPPELEVHSLYEHLSVKYLPAGAQKQTFLYFTHMCMAARAIYKWVQENITYISDPPDDWFKPALHTFIVRRGDCDDLAILLCSLWRSVGFKTYLGFLPGHVLSGVILAQLSAEPIKRDELPPEVKKAFPEEEDAFFIVEEVRVPADPRLSFRIRVGEVDRSFDVFDLAFRGKEFKEKLIVLTKELERMPPEVREKAEREFEKDMDEMIGESTKLLSAETFEIEPMELGRLLEEEG